MSCWCGYNGAFNISILRESVEWGQGESPWRHLRLWILKLEPLQLEGSGTMVFTCWDVIKALTVLETEWHVISGCIILVDSEVVVL